jgi:hypothetical protein
MFGHQPFGLHMTASILRESTLQGRFRIQTLPSGPSVGYRRCWFLGHQI